MDKIRLGNDIEMRWSIFTRDGDNKVPYNLEGRALTLSVVNRTGESEIEFFAEGNIVTGVFRGRDQKIIGKHGVILRENNGKDGMRTIDACDAFELVACSCEEALGSSGTIQLFHLTFDSTIGAITGTIDPILNYEAEQAEAERKANEIIRKANEGQRIDNEKQRNVNEILRNTAEEERKDAEQERIVNEDLRKADETDRKTNEESRVHNESERISSEEERLYGESIRVANENARIASEAKRKEAETARIEAEDKRIVSEKSRLSAESSRIANEDSRRANEDSRLSAEAKRVSAEEGRQIAEEERQAKFASMVVQTTGDATDKVMSQKAVTEALKDKQNKLTAGSGISIDGDVISATLNADIIRVVDALPSVGEANLIYLVPAEQPSESDLFEEWVWTDKWERIGSAKIDLSDYATKGYVDIKISSTEENLVHKDGYEIITGRKQFQNGIYVGRFNSLVANEDSVQSGAWLDQNENPAPFIVADPTADDHAATKLYVDRGLATKQDTLTAGNGISIEGGVISSTVDSLITPITYAELVALRNSASLVAGMQYRITDYACTTTQENTQSAGHPFDIIVTADSENTLNEEARAIQHEGDTYFADCDLNAWKIWYCLDNDATRFAWADSVNGKGVIYRMIDEWNNDVPYDFKNIQFSRDWSVIAPDSGLAGTIYCYTFSIFLDGFSEDTTANDESVKAKECIKSDGGGFFGNNVVRTNQNMGIYSLNDIVFFTDWTENSISHFSNTFGNSCFSNTFGNYCNFNIFGNECFSNIFGNNYHHNTFGNGSYYNTFGYNCYYNTFGNNCHHNTFGNECNSNIFGNDCHHNTFGNDCDSTTFGNYCFYIKFASTSSATTKYNYYRHNYFGEGCQYILFKGAETASDSAQVQNYNFAQGVQGTSSAYLTIDGVRSRAYETKVAKNSSGELKIYCEADLIQ